MVTKDNRNLMDNNSSQLLSYEEIKSMKEAMNEGNTQAKDIIDSVIYSSTTFKDKNEYSQDKYIIKKQKKYQNSVQIFHPTPYLLSKHFFERSMDPSYCLRTDTLSHILSLSGVRSKSKVLLMEDTRGILAGSILDRLDGHGLLLYLTSKGCVSHNITDFMNLTSDQKKIFHKLPLSDLLNGNNSNVNSDEGVSNSDNALTVDRSFNSPIKEEIADTLDHTASNALLSLEERNCLSSMKDQEDNLLPKDISYSSEPISNSEPSTDVSSQKMELNKDECNSSILKVKPFSMDQNQLREILKGNYFDTLILAVSSQDHLSLLEKLQKYIKPSRNIIIYCSYKEVRFILNECVKAVFLQSFIFL